MQYLYHQRQRPVDSWQCDICQSISGRGFEATFEVLPRLKEIKFSSGVIDELLFLDLPRESRFPSGIMMLEYGKAVQESKYDQLRLVRQGQLRVLFTPDLKVYQLLQVAHVNLQLLRVDRMGFPSKICKQTVTWW